MLRVKDLEAGTHFYTRDVLDGEVRQTFYMRDPDGSVMYKNNVKIARFGFEQRNIHGDVRVSRFLDGPCRDPGEMPGLTPCYLTGDDDARKYVRTT